MASVNPKITGINSEWLARDRGRYIVRIPTPNGSGNFDFKDYGGSSVKALKAAKIFQKRMLKQLEFDRKYYHDNGEHIERVRLHVNNKSGYPGVSRQVFPNGFQNPRIVWFASWTDLAGRRHSIGFSSASSEIKNEQDAKQKAVAYAEEKRTGKFR
jgi:hypothetical protein